MKKSFGIALILTVSMSMFAQTPDYAGLTIDKATVITDTVELLVQDPMVDSISPAASTNRALLRILSLPPTPP